MRCFLWEEISQPIILRKISNNHWKQRDLVSLVCPIQNCHCPGISLKEKIGENWNFISDLKMNCEQRKSDCIIVGVSFAKNQFIHLLRKGIVSLTMCSRSIAMT